MEKKQTAMTEAVYYILLSLKTPNHGYGIIQNTIQMTEGRLELGAGTLYGAINTLLDKGWIQLYSGDKHSRKKKQYVMTEEGQQALNQIDMPDLQGTSLSSRDRKKREYIEFVEETGAEYVCSWGFYMIFRKKTEQGEFKL